ncbi:hypothetical protein [Salinicola sp. DM10]|uniref:hypothetical protein n=1 Tax=Salinicola sp. DM10 TaxID=2815721 RepID=UPI001A8E4AB3|nr:hypothetical protein [Salinicola sp. DM10]MCE3025726.1 hypothetical protein [Salinicola sp. DM10]
MPQLFLNNARAVLAKSISAGETVIRVRDPDNLPSALADGDYFLLTLFSDTTRYGENIEVVRVTAVTSGQSGELNLTVERGFEFPERIHTAGERVEARLTAQSLRDLLSDAIAHADSGLARKLNATEFNPAELLAMLLTVDSDDSGLNASTLQGVDLAGLRGEIKNAVAGVVDSSPGQLDTLKELASALNNDADFAATVSAQIAKKLDSGAYTAEDVLAKLLTVDGAGSGVDADTVRGQEMGTAATRNVGTAASELMEVGAFGIGSAGSQIITNPANLPEYGTFFQFNGANTEGLPGSSNYYGGIALTRKSGSLINAVWIVPDSTALYTLRKTADGGIEALTFVNNKNMVGSVGAGLPGVIESGENSNGRYIKYADGSLVMTFEAMAVRSSSSERYLQFRWTYPYAVINPRPFATMEYANSNVPGGSDKKIYPSYDKDGVQVALISKSSNQYVFVDVFKTDISAPFFEENAAAYVLLQATGRWK